MQQIECHVFTLCCVRTETITGSEAVATTSKRVSTGHTTETDFAPQTTAAKIYDTPKNIVKTVHKNIKLSRVSYHLTVQLKLWCPSEN